MVGVPATSVLIVLVMASTVVLTLSAAEPQSSHVMLDDGADVASTGLLDEVMA